MLCLATTATITLLAIIASITLLVIAVIIILVIIVVISMCITIKFYNKKDRPNYKIDLFYIYLLKSYKMV